MSLNTPDQNLEEIKSIVLTQATEQHLSPAAAKALLEALPDHIRTGILNHAEKIDYPVELVLEMAIAGFLDDECLNFADCKPPHLRA